MTLLREQTEKIVSNSSNVTVATAVVLVAFISWALLSPSKRDDKLKGLKEVPSPKGSLPYFGHILSLEEEAPIAQFNRWHKELGPLVSINMGVKKWMLVSDPSLAYELFNVNGRYTSERPFTVWFSKYYALNSKGLTIGNPSDQWKKTRAAAVQFLSPKNRVSLEKRHLPEADLLITSLLKVTKENGVVDVHFPLHLASLNVMLLTCFGKRADSMEDPLFKEATATIRESMRRGSPSEEMNTFLPILNVFEFFLRKQRGMKKFVDEKRDPLIGGLIKEAVDNNIDCFSKSLTELEDVNEDDNLLVTVSDMIFAGTDTTAVTLSWMMVILCQHPQVQERIRNELDQFITRHKRLPTFDERENFPYSNSVQKECMRLHPTTQFGLIHETKQEFECRGYRIPAGVSIACNMVAMHRNADVFSEPNKFIPERFIDHDKPMYASANGKIEERDHFNFGWGRRTCPGAYLAELEIFNVWVRLFAKCVIEPAVDASGNAVYPDCETRIHAGIVALPKNPVMRIVERADALL